MGMDIDDVVEMYEGKADNRGALKRDYDEAVADNDRLRKIKEENDKFNRAWMLTNADKIALRLVATFSQRCKDNAFFIPPHAVIGMAYTAVQVLDTTIWDTEDDNSPPDDDFDTYETALAHAENAIRELITAMSHLVP